MNMIYDTCIAGIVFTPKRGMPLCYQANPEKLWKHFEEDFRATVSPSSMQMVEMQRVGFEDSASRWVRRIMEADESHHLVHFRERQAEGDLEPGDIDLDSGPSVSFMATSILEGFESLEQRVLEDITGDIKEPDDVNFDPPRCHVARCLDAILNSWLVSSGAISE
ncbi:MAG: hypothetical protein M1835_002676, partial [Candelina submexicana]